MGRLNDMSDELLEKREWVYVREPRMYDIAGCECGNENPEWSEYKDKLWCRDCLKDFIPKHWGMFEGPIMYEVCKLMGISFDRYNFVKERIEKCSINDKGEIEYL